jgi:HAE1 family hydrophobic/amphiphilic exporter-1
MIKKQSDANAVDVSKLIKAKFQTIEKNNASNADVKFVVTDDSTDNTIAAVNSVVFDLILAVILVSYRNAYLFLRSYRNSLIVLPLPFLLP